MNIKTLKILNVITITIIAAIILFFIINFSISFIALILDSPTICRVSPWIKQNCFKDIAFKTSKVSTCDRMPFIPITQDGFSYNIACYRSVAKKLNLKLASSILILGELCNRLVLSIQSF